MGDVIIIAGLDTREFERNPIALLSHNSSGWPIGTWSALTKILSASPPRLDGTLTLHPGGGPIPLIDQAAWAISNGALKAASIGLIPDWNAIEMIFDANGAATGGLKFNRSTLVECSVVAIPANADALAKSLGFRPDATRGHGMREVASRLAREAIEDVLDNWARAPSGALMTRAQYERLYQRTPKQSVSRRPIEVAKRKLELEARAEREKRELDILALNPWLREVR